MEARIKNPGMLIPDAIQSLQALAKVAEKSGVDAKVLGMVHLRASQINGCSVCVDLSYRMKHGETDERLLMVSAWRDAPNFTGAERAALALAEAVTRLNDREDPVPDAVWNEAARHYNEKELAAILLHIAVTNVWNRINVATRQVAGEWAKSADSKEWMERKTA
jgi:AhpD family alkylhydroperoxidase